MRKFLTVIALLACLSAHSQTRWIDPFAEGAQTHGQGWSELRGGFSRLPDKAHGVVRQPVWDLSRQSAGLSLVFRSNSKCITVRYTVDGGHSMFHMPSTGVSGVDMYATGKDGKLRWCACDFTPSYRDTITFRYSGLTYYEGNEDYEYRLYMPLYNTVTWMQIGVDEGADLAFVPVSSQKPVVVYGTSITQGACASRPGMAWTNIVGRELGLPVVNLGFSGNGKLELELFDLLAEIDASMYIIDCMPNMSPDSPIRERVLAGVAKLREAHECPILLVEHSGHSNFVSNSGRRSFIEINGRLREAYDAVRAAGHKNIYYLTYEQVGFGMEGMVEGVHPTDLGMRRQADAYEKALRRILHLRRAGKRTNY